MSAPPNDPAGSRYPNTARIWNYQLGGDDNYPADREASEAANAMVRGWACRPVPTPPQRAETTSSC